MRYLVEAAPTYKSGKALAGLSAAEIAQLIADGKAGKEAKSYTTTFNRLPALMSMPAQSINPLVFRNAVKTVWPDNPATVKRMVKRLGMLLKWQETGEHRGNNPKVTNHEAMPYQDVPAYMRHLATRNAVGALPLRWTILTAARTGDVLGDPDIDPLGATWKEISEIDGAPVWIISAERMKMQFRHVVPLTPEMLSLLGPRGADDQRLPVA